jgi:DNA-directed RNA polymerase subunit RPC12/RpoP
MVIEYRCLDCGNRFPYGELAKLRQDTCPVCGYELVPVGDTEMEDSPRPALVAHDVSVSPEMTRLIAVFVAVSGLIFALALLLPK